MRRLWDGKLSKIEDVDDIKSLPIYSHQFFFKYIGPFKKAFFVLTSIAALTAAVGFFTTYLISDLISNVSSITTQRLFMHYLLLYLLAKFIYELLCYFIRRYSEAIPQMYTDYIRIAFYRKIIDSNFHRLLGYSNEKLSQIINKYVQGISHFLSTWVWATPFMITNLIIVILILAVQSPIILAINVLYFGIFLGYAISISAKFGELTKVQSQQFIDSDAKMTDLTLHLTSIKRLLVPDFFSQVAQIETELKWERLKDVREFHAKRWLIQLNIFNIVYIATLFTGLYQVINGQLDLGFILLINWAYSNLWGVIVFAIEYYVALVEQRENSRIVNRELGMLVDYKRRNDVVRLPPDWKVITFKEVSTSFTREDGNSTTIRIPELAIRQGDKIGITGRSGSGKSTVINILLGLLEYRGVIEVDGEDMRNYKFGRKEFCLISSDDHIFNISVKDNILLGEKEDKEKLQHALDLSQSVEFLDDINDVVGKGETGFSTGQKQRLRIARGIYQDASFYLMDEPLSGIDKDNKDEIMGTLKLYLRNKTVLMISHIQEELDLVDKLYVIEDGVLRERE